MKRIFKAAVLSCLCMIIFYSMTRDFFASFAVLVSVFIILFINEIVSLQKDVEVDMKLSNYSKEIEKDHKQIKKLEKLLTYRSELDVGLIHLNSIGRIEYCNEYFTTNIHEEVEHYSQFTNENIYEVIRDIYDEKKVFNNLMVGNKYYAIKYKVSIKHNEIRSVAVQFYDVTKTELLDKLHQSFLVDASHELNNPLASIIMASEIIERENKSDISDILIKESYRMKNVIDSIIEHSKLQTSSFEMREVDLSTLCNSYKDIYKDRKVEFVCDIEDNVFIDGNYDLINRMFKNLIDNAFNYTDNGSVKLSVHTEKNNVICTIEDTGIGIEKDNIPNIFDRFYREDTSRSRMTGGSGIGLAIVKEIASVHDIVITVDSEVDKGSKFKLVI